LISFLPRSVDPVRNTILSSITCRAAIAPLIAYSAGVNASALNHLRIPLHSENSQRLFQISVLANRFPKIPTKLLFGFVTIMNGLIRHRMQHMN